MRSSGDVVTATDTHSRTHVIVVQVVVVVVVVVRVVELESSQSGLVVRVVRWQRVEVAFPIVTAETARLVGTSVSTTAFGVTALFPLVICCYCLLQEAASSQRDPVTLPKLRLVCFGFLRVFRTALHSLFPCAFGPVPKHSSGVLLHGAIRAIDLLHDVARAR